MFPIKFYLLQKNWNDLVKIEENQKPLKLRKSYFFEKSKNSKENI